MTRKLILAGGSGFLGAVLANCFAPTGAEIVILTRNPRRRVDSIREVYWDGATLGTWGKELESAQAIVNLAGVSVNCRYHARNRKLLLDSRLDSTRVLGEAIARCVQPPRVWLNSSTATIYKHTLGPAWDESGETGGCVEAKDLFSVHIATEWERIFNEANTPHTRKVALRSAMVLGHARNSVLPNLLRLARLGLGGSLAGGRQFVSWIHEDDFSRAVAWILECEALSGPVNIAAPHPVTNAEFMAAIRQVCRAPFGLPAPRWLLEIGAFIMRTETELVIKSRRVVPGKLLASGFTFQHPHLLLAIESLIRQSTLPHPAKLGVRENSLRKLKEIRTKSPPPAYHPASGISGHAGSGATDSAVNPTTTAKSSNNMNATLKTKLVLTLCAAMSGLAVVSAQNSQHQQKTVSSSSTGLSISTVNGQSVVTLNGKQIYTGPTKGQVSSRSSNVNGVEYSAVFDGDTLLWESVPGAARQLQSGGGTPAGFDHKQFLEQHQQTVERMKEEQRKFMEMHAGTNFSHGTSGGFSRSGGGGSAGGSSGGFSRSGGGSSGGSFGSGQSGGGGRSFGSGQSGGHSGGHSESRTSTQGSGGSISTKTVNGSTVVTFQGKDISVGPTQGQVSARTTSVNGTIYAAAFDGDRVIWENLPGAAQQLK